MSRRFLLLLLLLTLLPLARASAQQDEARQLLALINQARLDEGYPPLAWSPLLAQAARRHAEDMAEHQFTDSRGSDGSTYQQRIREAGYHAWNDGLMVNELLWAGSGTPHDAFTWLHGQPGLWKLLVDKRYREIGIAEATGSDGVHYYTLDLGSRPGILPVFINDGAETTDSPQVAVRLTNEEAVPLGEGRWIGKAIEIRLNDSPEFDDTIPWQPWDDLVPWLLPGTTSGDYAVYVQFRDGAGRTTISEDTIRLVIEGETPQPSPTPTPDTVTATPTPPPTPTTPPPSPTPTPLHLPTATPTPTPPPTAIPTATPIPTWTPLPTATPETDTSAPPADGAVVAALVLHGLALLLLLYLFLKRR